MNAMCRMSFDRFSRVTLTYIILPHTLPVSRTRIAYNILSQICLIFNKTESSTCYSLLRPRRKNKW